MANEQAAPAGKGGEVVPCVMGRLVLAVLGCGLFALVGSQLGTSVERLRAP